MELFESVSDLASHVTGDMFSFLTFLKLLDSRDGMGCVKIYKSCRNYPRIFEFRSWSVRSSSLASGSLLVLAACGVDIGSLRSLNR